MPISEDTLERIAKNDPSLHTIHLSSQYPPLDAEDMQKLAKKAKASQNSYLKRLIFQENMLEDQGIKEVSELKSIERLSVAANEITDTGAEYISTMENLKKVDISGNLINDEGLSKIATLPQLFELVISGYELGPKSIQAILDSRTITELVIIEEKKIDKAILSILEKHTENNKQASKSAPSEASLKAASTSPAKERDKPKNFFFPPFEGSSKLEVEALQLIGKMLFDLEKIYRESPDSEKKDIIAIVRKKLTEKLTDMEGEIATLSPGKIHGSSS